MLKINYAIYNLYLLTTKNDIGAGMNDLSLHGQKHKRDLLLLGPVLERGEGTL